MEEKRSSRKRKRDEIDIGFILKKFDEFTSIIHEIKTFQKNSLNNSCTSEINRKNLKNCDKIEIECCCCQRSNIKCCNEDNRNKNFIDVKFVAELKNNDTMINEISNNENSINRSYIDNWIKIAKESFSINELLLLFTKYEINDDYLKELKAPKLNENLRNLVDEETIKNDEINSTKQNNIASLLSIIKKFLSIIVQRGKQSMEISRLVEFLNDIGKLNASIHHDISMERRKVILAFLNIEDKNDSNLVEEELFSSTTVDRFLMKRYWEEEIAKLRRDILTRTAQTQTLPITITSNSCGTQTEEIERRNDNDVATSFTPAHANIAQNSAVAQNRISSQNPTVSQNRSIGQNCTIMQNHTAAKNCTITQNRTAAQNRTVAKNFEQIPQKTQITKEQADGKTEDKTKEEPVESGILDPKEKYPGSKEVVRRALKIRGELQNFPKLQDSTWKRYDKYLLSWWLWCQIEQTNFANPSGNDIARFWEKVRRAGESVFGYRPALSRFIPPELVKNMFLTEFHSTVKEEKNK